MCYISKFFKDDEFQRVACTRSQINDDSLRRLDRAREIAGIPFVLTSAYRSPEHDISCGRSGSGAHTLGQAFDIACCSSVVRWKIVHAALAAGFPRIGIGKTFIHLDDSKISGPVIWLY